jgi:hypothetical protein
MNNNLRTRRSVVTRDPLNTDSLQRDMEQFRGILLAVFLPVLDSPDIPTALKEMMIVVACHVFEQIGLGGRCLF